MKIQHTTYLSLGSNLGDKLANLQNALYLISEKIGRISVVSPVYKTQAWGFESDDFLNCCIGVSTGLDPQLVMGRILDIEQQLGRERFFPGSEKKYRARSIDIDILLFDDQVLSDKHLEVPHPKMLERRFVLTPLADIAPNTMHPTVKKTIAMCLQSCADVSQVEKTDFKLNRPVTLIDKYNYIAIEGNIGAGKTSLAKRIADDFNAKLVLERFADNPFLPKYYADMERYAFPLEMSFLADRFQQLTDDLAQFDLFKNFVVSDYYIFKSLLFAQVSLAREEYTLYRRMFDIIYKEIAKPDLYVYLYQNTSRLLENIRKRGREYEQEITADYLERIHQGYSNFIRSDQHLNTVIIDVSELDFVNFEEDYTSIIQKITSL
ncbi:MAG: 2-amino-4-hydroxy-6-hydroxymethyldihydropteridine diphosphokinase [Flavobacteriaceae bacterium]|nr:2-amino-4-hydroxy-6-hydroxymethyldihydropteridine diphosphokinase [Flavobacteriaceae bacterium]